MKCFVSCVTYEPAREGGARACPPRQVPAPMRCHVGCLHVRKHAAGSRTAPTLAPLPRTAAPTRRLARR